MNLRSWGRVVSTRLFCLLVFWSAVVAAQSPDTTSPSAPAPTPNVSSQVGSAVAASERFGIRVDTPSPELRAFLLRHMALQRFRSLADLDTSELDRLLVAAPENLRDLLGTQGFFSPEVTVTREAPQTTASAAASSLGEVVVRVTPGPTTRVAAATAYFSGDIANAEAATGQREALRQRSQRAVGQGFTQAGWSRLKSDLLRELTAERYPRGRIVNSLSDIDNRTNQAIWYVELDSGAPVRVGEVQLNGAQRYDPATVQRLVRLAGLGPGTDYSLARLQDAQQRIVDTGYYSSVFAYVDLDASANDPNTPAPVVVQVTEAPLQSIVLGVGGSTDNGPRLSAEHKHLRLPGLGWQALSKLQLERKDQLLSSDWSAPVEDKGWQWLAGGRLARQIDDTTTVSSLRLRLGKSQPTARLDRRYFVQYDRSRTVNTASALASSDGNEASVSVNYGWTWRRFDTLPYPNQGYGLGLTLGAGTTLDGARKPFLTSQARWLAYWPLGQVFSNGADKLSADRTPDNASDKASNGTSVSSRLGRLALRLQGGAVLAQQNAPIPDSQLFLTGGDNTVRGYGLRDIGVLQSDGSVSAGRYLAVAGLEWQRPIWREGLRTDWESVLFVDAGAVTNRSTPSQARVGVGAGVRYNSPVGPLQLDLAYGITPKRLRLHLNVGFSF